ncbi:MAG: FAD-binding oxidoreductase [Acidobacteriia bacterium]|nr:FAD-binding oxidoreductase [Terriglobia bacterium]
MPRSATPRDPWGTPPWPIDFQPPKQPLPPSVDFAIIGGGFTGLAAAAWLRSLAPEKSVAVLEATRIGAGASGRTGGMVLAESAAGDLPGLGDVLHSFAEILKQLGVNCDLTLSGAWEIGRRDKVENSPIEWKDSGTLRVVNEVPGGTLDPGRLVAGLARAAHQRGAVVIENAPVERVEWSRGAELHVPNGFLRAEKVLFATNGLSLGLSGLEGRAEPRLTLAAATEPLREDQLQAIGLSHGKPFYTVDFPYLWGRTRSDNSIVWGAGLVAAPDSQHVEQIDISSNEPARMFASLEQRVRNLHPALADVHFTHRWGGPILFRENWKPVFSQHPASANSIVLGAYAGHGVALSAHLGVWAAEALLGRRELPDWGHIEPS